MPDDEPQSTVSEGPGFTLLNARMSEVNIVLDTKAHAASIAVEDEFYDQSLIHLELRSTSFLDFLNTEEPELDNYIAGCPTTTYLLGAEEAMTLARQLVMAALVARVHDRTPTVAEPGLNKES